MEQLEAQRDKMQEAAGEAEGEECDRAALESAYSGRYTTEIERSIMRAALYGESVPAATAAAIAGNDVELF